MMKKSTSIAWTFSPCGSIHFGTMLKLMILKYPFWEDVEADDTQSWTDENKTADFDKDLYYWTASI